MSGTKVGLRLSTRPCKQTLFRPITQSQSYKAIQGLTGTRSLFERRLHLRCAAVQDHIPPATLPETTKDFPIPEKELIAMCKKYGEDTMRPVGADDDSVLADDFKFEFPVVKLNKKKYLEAVRTFDFLAGVPNISNNAYDFRVDKFEPHRVWYTVRVSGTHTGTLKFFGREVKPTGRKILGAPECISMTFNREGKVTSLTGGYVMDNRLGTCNKLGGLFGILNSMGIFVPFPQSGTLGWKVGSAVDSGVHFIKQVLHFFTFGVFKEKPKTA